MKQRSRVATVLLGGLLVVALASASQASEDAGWGYALADELMSPWCPGFALPDCASGYASDLRLWILEQERLGRPEADVKAEILARYGQQMLQAPSAEGRGVLSYAIPGVLILAGLGVLVMFLRGQALAARARGVENLGANREAVDGALLSRVDAELAHFERQQD